MPQFVTAADLCASFYADVVAPAVRVPHSAGLLGPGSDVLGYDTERSTDHDWGPRCTVLVAAEHVDAARAAVAAALPATYRGWPVAIGRDGRPPTPHVPVLTPDALLHAELGLAPGRGGLDVLDWLLVPQQRLLGLTAGAVFADETGVLARLRGELAWYPEPVWWWLLACQWRRLAEEEPFVQRAAEVGDDAGSRVVTARLV